MAIAAAAVIVPLGLLFFVSGLVVNLIQGICFILVRPLSKNTYRRINRVVAELLWLELVWLIDWWAGVKIQVYTDPETFRLMAVRLPWQHLSCNEEIIKVPSGHRVVNVVF
ncbi:1-acyl-sn-glycerol-3-phosphate acyltransferase 2-like isoform X2 [Pyrus communis]|uniref:1-acyl-sn-glycerol-3-phosphate acyltransferase 2-like isoform X2 n=1 Tax=Pyrus communis TaxID=23211 RepID=UPI0035C09A46